VFERNKNYKDKNGGGETGVKKRKGEPVIMIVVSDRSKKAKVGKKKILDKTRNRNKEKR
jgi:hypothetical protein